jgi:hypothetical protein
VTGLAGRTDGLHARLRRVAALLAPGVMLRGHDRMVDATLQPGRHLDDELV